ncbi:MAG: biosynthetic arginine decarboxylase [Candidatus Kapabacteria bacterium]|nr:biosynthetic arginine decarboxylase [Ignavibacteria bacterium]MBP6510533.1 biosynthetic arginine decarboxylase [Candidatus Kapabacteria bacterium]MBK6418104.1 biosynthetic arginine decarboxylase [Ignavibacteria bacterium]MBK6761360.1 biosynthetic arginine decarboxylase [Ignavibacteria bacterium]MBK7032389.1 biosynthetic arginine decarboxylase [Ignavibacteria bacterium]
MRKWRVEDSIETYHVPGWGIGYFGINSKGHATAMPRKAKGPQIDLKELIDELILRDVSVPVLLRFPDILDDRIEKIAGCFAKAAADYDYTGKYFSVYPIKVNQQRPVVEEIVRHGRRFNIGLEAGSKPELHAVLAIMNNEESLIICNGYKDEEFIELGLLAQKMGKKIFLVVEKLSELRLINEVAKRVKVRPNIGIRIKLASSGSGKWEESGGDQSKFGLNASELLEAVDYARENDMLDCLKLIHFHLGSQITNIRKIKQGLGEVSQFYVQMMNLGCKIEFVDIGGGLGVDYDGSRSSVASSINYSIQEYANDAIATIADAAIKNQLPHPNIITESGRALTAHHSVLVFNVLETTSVPTWSSKDRVTKKDHELVHELHDLLSELNSRTMLEAWHDCQQVREETLDRFSLGLIDLRTRAQVERLYWTIAHKINEMAVDMKQMPEELRSLPKLLADKYFCNFSLFQSLPDSWAIDQLFPIMPIHRLNERPTRMATLQDITCDSDGKIDHFIGVRDFTTSLPVHTFKADEPYYMAVYLVGAYQEILGDLHNLFGDTNAVHVTVTDKSYEIDQVIDGETVADVLDYVQFNAKKLVRTMEAWVSASVKEKRISVHEGKEFLAIYRSGLYGYTYLEE